MCGGSFGSRRDRVDQGGTSPRVRGKRGQRRPRSVQLRYIPACAGEARFRTGCWRRRTVHPRVCGGSTARTRPRPRGWGTSPRVRGKRCLSRSRVGWLGYIPACAGEASSRSPSCGQRRVHPRVCGGSRSLIGPSCPALGTSPRVRGKLICGAVRVSPMRYIPACAGEAAGSLRPLVRTGVHPRVCGGSVNTRKLLFLTKGTSPRVRGKPLWMPGGIASKRYIPACAGEAPR